jgi:hypothetical protein
MKETGKLFGMQLRKVEDRKGRVYTFYFKGEIEWKEAKKAMDEAAKISSANVALSTKKAKELILQSWEEK